MIYKESQPKYKQTNNLSIYLSIYVCIHDKDYRPSKEISLDYFVPITMFAPHLFSHVGTLPKVCEFNLSQHEAHTFQLDLSFLIRKILGLA